MWSVACSKSDLWRNVPSVLRSIGTWCTARLAAHGTRWLKVGQSLDALESGQVRCLLLCSRQHTFACKSEWGLRVAQRDLVELLGY